MTDKTDMDAYKQGLVEGRLLSLEQIANSHEQRMDKHESRLRTLEKAAYLLIGAVSIMQFLPEIKAFLAP